MKKSAGLLQHKLHETQKKRNHLLLQKVHYMNQRQQQHKDKKKQALIDSYEFL